MKYFSTDDVRRVVFGGEKLQLPEEAMKEVERCYRFLEEFHKDKVIYGINTGFGPMAQWRVEDQYLKDLQYNIIRSHSTGAGKPLGDASVRAAMVARIGTFLQARSGIHPDVVRLLAQFINNGNYELLLEAKEDGEVVRIYVVGDEKTVTSLVMIEHERDEINFLSMDGNMDFLDTMEGRRRVKTGDIPSVDVCRCIVGLVATAIDIVDGKVAVVS